MKESAKDSERRRVPRVKVEFPVVVSWGRKQFRWPARECSEYGILLAGSNKELVGEELKLQLNLEPNQPPLSLVGVAVYSAETGVGIRFKNVSPEDQFSLKYYVQSRGIGITRP